MPRKRPSARKRGAAKPGPAKARKPEARKPKARKPKAQEIARRRLPPSPIVFEQPGSLSFAILLEAKRAREEASRNDTPS